MYFIKGYTNRFCIAMESYSSKVQINNNKINNQQSDKVRKTVHPIIVCNWEMKNLYSCISIVFNFWNNSDNVSQLWYWLVMQLINMSNCSIWIGICIWINSCLCGEWWKNFNIFKILKFPSSMHSWESERTDNIL